MSMYLVIIVYYGIVCVIDAEMSVRSHIYIYQYFALFIESLFPIPGNR